MIVVSGALLLVAVVLLGLGLATTDLSFVYGSIGVSLVSFGFLVVGILQHRGEPLAADGPPLHDDATPSPTPLQREAEASRPTPAPVPVTPPATAQDAVDQDEDDDEYGDDDLEPGGGPVLVVLGDPRYHVEGCRVLTGQAEEVDVLDAQEDGVLACVVCRPDEVLEELYGPLVVEDEDGNEVLLTTAAPRPEADDGTRVVVVPHRGRFHAPSCRFAHDVAGATGLSRAQAVQSGLRPCGVCRP